MSAKSETGSPEPGSDIFPVESILPEQLDEIKWNLKEIQNTISNIENKIKK